MRAPANIAKLYRAKDVADATRFPNRTKANAHQCSAGVAIEPTRTFFAANLHPNILNGQAA